MAEDSPRRRRRKIPEPPALLDGLPPDAWLAQIETTDDPVALKRLLRRIMLHVQRLRLAAEEQGVRLPQLYAPSKAILKTPPKRRSTAPKKGCT
jgi:hypothetical protein